MPQDFTAGQVLTAAQMDTLSGAVDGYATTATAAGTTTLTVASYYQQFFTGSTTQTVVMPVASTLVVGWKIRIVNNSSGIVTVKSSGANTIYAVPAGGDVIFTCILASGTTAASWDYKDSTSSASSFVGALCTKSASQSITSSTYTSVTFDTEIFDTSAFHDNSTNNTRMTIPSGKAGYYLIYWGIQMANGDWAGIHRVLVDGATYSQGNILKDNSVGWGEATGSIVINLTVGQYVEVQVYSGGGTQNCQGNDTGTKVTKFGLTYLGA